MSLRLEPVRLQARGMPVASTSRCCLEPGRLYQPGSGPSWRPLFRPDLARVDDRPRPLDLTRRPQPREQVRVQTLPYPCPLPLVQAPPTGDPGSEAELLRQVRPRDPRVENEEDPLQRLPVGEAPAAWVTETPLPPREQRLDQLPQLVGDDPRRGSHRHPSQLDDRSRPASSSASGSLHSETTS